VAKRLILRRGKLTGCIVNQGFEGSGTRLKSETISPAVTRETKPLGSARELEGQGTP